MSDTRTPEQIAAEQMKAHEKWVDDQAGVGYFRKRGNLTLDDTSEQYERVDYDRPLRY